MAEPSSAEEQIRRAVARYAHGVDRLDVAVMKSAYWPDAVDDHGVYVGDAMAFCERVVASHARYDATMHCVLNHLIELERAGPHDRATRATGEVYNVTYVHRTEVAEDGTRRRHLDTWWGRYLDRYECRDGEWRIIHRTCVHEFTASTELHATMPIDAARFRQGSEDRGVSG